MTLNDNDILELFERAVRPMRSSLPEEVFERSSKAQLRVTAPDPTHVVASPERVGSGRRRQWGSALLLVAAGTMLITGLALVTRSRPQRAPLASVPTAPAPTDVETADGVAVILAPPPGSDIELVRFSEQDVSEAASGALVSPDGTVFSIGVTPLTDAWITERPEWGSTPDDRRGLSDVAGYEVAAIVDATSPTQIYRLIRDECWSIGVNTAGESMWSDDLTTFLEGLAVDNALDEDAVIAVDEAAVTVEVPAGWRSLGGARMLRSWSQQLEVEVDGNPHEVQLVQVPNAPIGYVVGGETNPRPYAHGADEWWQIDIATTPGITTVAGYGLATFTITSDLSAEQLVAIVDSLVPTPVNRITPGSATTNTADAVVETAVPATVRSTCGDLGTGIEIAEH